MAFNFNAEQYDREFNSKRLQNWQTPKDYSKTVPKAQLGFTQFIADDGGHLLAGVPRSGESPWGSFVGTWDMPKKLPGPRVDNSTAREPEAHAKLLKEREEALAALKAAKPSSCVGSLKDSARYGCGSTDRSCGSKECGPNASGSTCGGGNSRSQGQCPSECGQSAGSRPDSPEQTGRE